MTPTDSIKTLIDKTKDYLDTKIELTKLKAVDASADILSSVVVLISVLLTGFLFVLFLSLSLAMLLGKKLGSQHYGFLIVGGIYGLLLIIIFVRRLKWIKKPIANGLINKMLK